MNYREFDILDNQIAVGQIKTITRNGGRTVDYIEIMFSPTVKAQFVPNEERTELGLCVKDTDLSLPKLECSVNKTTLKDLIKGLESIYHQLNDNNEESEET